MATVHRDQLRGLSRAALIPASVLPTKRSHDVHELPGVWFIMCLAGSCIALASGLAVEGISISPSGLAPAGFGLVCFVTALLRHRFRNPQNHHHTVLRDFSEYIGVFAFICVAGAIASYPVAAASSGFDDAVLARIDAALGFRWIAWYEVTAAHPILQWLGSMAYQSIYLTPLLLFCRFAWTGERAKARLLIAAFWLAALLTLILFNFMPARGPLAYLWHGPIPYMPASELFQSQLIPLLRDHQMHIVALGTLRGLVCAPSFHTTSAVLFLITARSAGPLRWPLTTLNIMMLLATPVEGTHYLSDMIAGAIVAVLAYLAVVQLAAWSDRSQARVSQQNATLQGGGAVSDGRCE